MFNTTTNSKPTNRKNILQTMLNVNIHVHRHAQRIDWFVFFFYSGCIVHVNCEDELSQTFISSNMVLWLFSVIIPTCISICSCYYNLLLYKSK